MPALNRFLEILRGARKIEWLLLLVAVAVLLMQFSGVDDGSSEIEERLTEVLENVEGVGRVRVMIVEDQTGNPDGVLIVADGAKDMGVRLRLQAAVQTLLGMENTRIEIVQHDR